MNLQSLLSGTGSESGLSSMLGRWRQAISQVVDAIAPTKYVVAAMAHAPQVIADLGAATAIVLDRISTNKGVAYNATTGRFSLEASSVYELAFYPQWLSFNTVATDFAVYYWARTSDDNILADNTTAIAVPAASTQNLCAQTVARVIYTTTAAEAVYLKSAGGQGAASVGLESYAIVRKLGSAV